jgi:hypothetical protein
MQIKQWPNENEPNDKTTQKTKDLAIGSELSYSGKASMFFDLQLLINTSNLSYFRLKGYPSATFQVHF